VDLNLHGSRVDLCISPVEFEAPSFSSWQERRHVNQVWHQQLPYFRAQEAGYGAGADALLGLMVANYKRDLVMVKVNVALAANQEILE